MQTTIQQGAAVGRFDGMLKILRFNWKRYTLTLVVCCVTLCLIRFIASPLLRFVAFAGVSAALFWSLASLIASHWVYDLSEIYRWNWMARWLNDQPKKWVQIHAGLDESSAAIKTMFPQSEGTVFDIFDEKEMTEASIAEARKESAPSGTRADFRHLPAADQHFDTIFLIFAAHEIRRAESRDDFFKDLYRVLVANGHILIVEHLRDWTNFLAFGPGFFHFQTRSEWLRLAKTAGFVVEREGAMTPFVRVFLLRKDL